MKETLTVSISPAHKKFITDTVAVLRASTISDTVNISNSRVVEWAVSHYAKNVVHSIASGQLTLKDEDAAELVDGLATSVDIHSQAAVGLQ